MTFINFTGLETLARMQRIAYRKVGTVTIVCGPDNPVQHVLGEAGLGSRFTFRPPAPEFG